MNRQDEKRPSGPRENGEVGASERSKDVFFARVATLAEEMIAEHDKEFAMGTLVLAAKFIAEGRPLSPAADGGADE